MTALTFNIPVEIESTPLTFTLLKSEDSFVFDYQDFVEAIFQHNFFKDDPSDSMRNTFALMGLVLKTEFERRGFNIDDYEMEAKVVATIKKKSTE